MPDENIKELVATLLGGKTDEGAELREKIAEALLSRRVVVSPEEHIDSLRRSYELWNTKHAFTPGQLVRWKKGLKNRTMPREGEPAIVVEVLAEPIIDTTREAGSSYFREPLQLILGIIDPDGDFVTFHFDSRRFEPYEVQR